MVFVEPFFAKPQDAIVNGGAGVAAYAGLPHGSVETLWTLFLVFALVVVGAGLFAVVSESDEAAGPKWLGFKIASRFGRAAVIGGAALVLVIVTAAAEGREDFEWLAIGTALLLIGVLFEWPRTIRRVLGGGDEATVVASIGPRLLLLSKDLPIASSVVLGATGGIRGVVVARTPHSSGVRSHVALEGEWSDVCTTFPATLEIRPESAAVTSSASFWKALPTSDSSSNCSSELRSAIPSNASDPMGPRASTR